MIRRYSCPDSKRKRAGSWFPVHPLKTTGAGT